MTDPDQLPALPMRTLREEIAYQQAKGFYRNSIDLQTLLAWLGAETAAIATERARADALEAALRAALKHARANGMQGWPVFVAIERALLEKKT